MEKWWMLATGVALGAALGAVSAGWVVRRIWRNARRLLARARGHDHLAELGRLAGGLAHEIKNPLSTININLRLLAEDMARRGDEEHQRWLRRLGSVRKESDRLKTILDDFLRYAGKYELTLAPADLREVVSEVTDFFTPQANDARVVLRSSFPPGPVTCRVDKDLMKQALLNLMINAVQAMSDGGELLIRVAAQRGQGVIEVIDTGPGIPPDVRGRVFDVYYSTKKHGTGLGLPTTRRIVREHGGGIRVESEPGKGTRFVLTLPMDESRPPEGAKG
ncbi:MAG TPA: ATP-binding protein [Phycisphaerae bacterium]|nr:ATP-binding protein [Phycisphaerae bacterium]